MVPLAALDVTDVFWVLGAVVGVLAGALLTFRQSQSLYDVELGGLEVKLKEAGESATRAETVASSEREQRLDAYLERLVGTEDQVGRERAEELALRIAELVRAKDAAAAQAAHERSETILTDEYHAQGLAQSKIAFLFSLVFASLGFFLIGASVVAVLTGADVSAGVLTLVSGAVVEAVSALFFVQANRARALMVEFFDKLRVDRSLEESLRLSQTISDPLIRSRLQTVLAVRLAQAPATDDVLHTVMAAEVSAREPGPLPNATDDQAVTSASNVKP